MVILEVSGATRTKKVQSQNSPSFNQQVQSHVHSKVIGRESVHHSIVPDSVIPQTDSPPGSSVYGIFQEVILEWVAISFPRESSWPKARTQVSDIVDRLYRLSHWDGKLGNLFVGVTIHFIYFSHAIKQSNTKITIKKREKQKYR